MKNMILLAILFQSPSNRVKCSDYGVMSAIRWCITEFQSPSNRVKCSD